MIEINDKVTVYNDEEVSFNDVKSGRFVAIDKEQSLFIPSYTRRYDIYKVLFDSDDVSFDTAVPQSWFDEQWNKTGVAPQAIWVYERGDIFGKPVHWHEILNMLSDKCKVGQEG